MCYIELVLIANYKRFQFEKLFCNLPS